MNNHPGTLSLIFVLAIQAGTVHADTPQQSGYKTPVSQEKPDALNAPRERAKKRFQEDRSAYGIEELREIERLYQTANRQWRSPEARESLKLLIEKYPKANRTGCALLYLGQMSSGKEKETYLKQAIKDYSDCYYGDGVQVGAYARFHLARYYGKTGETNKARLLYEEIRNHYPDAVNHRGTPLSEIMPQ